MIDKSRNFAEELNSYVPPEDEVAVWWLGQSGFIIKTGKYCFITDPYLSTTLEELTKDMGPEIKHVRMMPVPVEPEAIECADYILCSHDHGDHYDYLSVSGLLKGSKNCKVIVPPAAKSKLVSDGIAEERIVTIGTEDIYKRENIIIKAIRAKHNKFDYSDKFGYPYVGYIIEMDGTCIYHAGDTILFDELPDMLKKLNIDIGLIPINGYDEARIKTGFQSNFMFNEAADIAKYAGIKVVIPCHYDMFTANTEQVGKFVNYMNSRENMPKYLIPIIGESLKIEKRSFK